MRSSLFIRLARGGLRKNGRLFLPYLLACVLCAMMFYVMLSLAGDGAVSDLPGGGEVKTVLIFGTIVIGIFSAIILFYTNSVLAKGRRREFGLYNVLGMEKRHIGRVLFWETAYTALIAIPGGLLAGVVFSKLTQLILVRMLNGHVGFQMRFDPVAAGLTVPLFLGIFFLIFLNDLRIIYAAKPVELLRASSEGEREPKSKWVLAILGVLFLLSGYALSIMTREAVQAILLFFVAALLVIAGTYLLFIAFSIVLLKGLRANKGYYYKTRHFATVSGMLYRMKRNAAGLASICVLSTMVLVTVSTTVSLYLGSGAIVDERYPYDISVNYPAGAGVGTLEEVTEKARSVAGAHGLTMSDFAVYPYLSFAARLEGNALTVEKGAVNGVNLAGLAMVELTTAEGYESITGEEAILAPGEALYYQKGAERDAISVLGADYSLRRMDAAPFDSGYENMGTDVIYLVVNAEETLEAIAAGQAAAYGDDASVVRRNVRFNLSGSKSDKLGYAFDLEEAVKVPSADGSYYYGYVDSKQMAVENDYFSFYGAFFFLGIFLGLMFLSATVLIIYYKQVSEGWDDRGRFAIMRKVGMTGAETRATIRQQVLIVFFLPLFTAAVHIAFAFPMIRRILSAFSMTDIPLFVNCTLATLGVFALLYTFVYLMTARTYYGIVGNEG
jgi:putative ABC transport system permease protein